VKVNSTISYPEH